MPSDNTVRGIKRIESSNTAFNSTYFLIEGILNQKISTVDMVIVKNVDAGGSGSAVGWVDVEPLVCQTDAYNNTIAPTTLFKLPYSRIQGGIAALVIDPVPGDIGIALFTKRDSSNVQQEQSTPVQPGSFRSFNQANGIYIGGILNKAPTIFLELDQDNNATLTAPESVTINTSKMTINCDDMTVNCTNRIQENCTTFDVYASSSAGLNSPSWGFFGFDGETSSGNGTIRGNLTQIGTYTQTGLYTLIGNMNQGGVITNTNIVSSGISFTGHYHRAPDGNTGGPVNG